MKKLMLLCVLAATFLACATAAFADTTTSQLQPGDCLAQVDNGAHAKGYGYVVIKDAKGGVYDVTYQLWNAKPGYSYYACSGALFFGYLKTDRNGKGSLTVHVKSKPQTWGNWLGLRETNGQLSTCGDPDPPFVPQSLLAAPNPFNPPL
jgi:hypothetical protein